MDRGWKRVRALFDEVVDLEGEARASWLALLSETDPELHAELVSLLEAEERATDRLAPLESATSPVSPSRDSRDTEELLFRVREHLSPRYQVEREVGRGGMATVFLADDSKHDRRVAIKVLRPKVAQAVGAERFLREIRIAARLTHPNILPLHDSGEAGGLLYYVMPFVEGESVHDRLAREGPLPVREAVRIAREVCEALAYAQEHGIVHRDIKPANILLSGGHAVIADFGIARALAPGAEDQSTIQPWAAAGAEDERTTQTGAPITDTGLAIGTPAYMSPEQATGEELDGRSDLYALGCVLYEMLTGEPPFVAASSRVMLTKHRTEPPLSIRKIRPEVPEALEPVLARALAKHPDDRFATARDLSEALADSDRNFGRPTRSAQTTLGGRRRSSRIPRPARLAMATACILLLGGAWAVWQGQTLSKRNLSPTDLVVLPFTVHGAGELEYLGPGIVSLLGTALDGVGPLRTVGSRATFGMLSQEGVGRLARHGAGQWLGASGPVST